MSGRSLAAASYIPVPINPKLDLNSGWLLLFGHRQCAKQPVMMRKGERIRTPRALVAPGPKRPPRL